MGCRNKTNSSALFDADAVGVPDDTDRRTALDTAEIGRVLVKKSAVRRPEPR